MVARDAFHFIFGPQDDADPFMQLAGLNVQNSVPTIGGSATSLFDEPAHRVGFVHQSKFAGFIWLPLVPGVHEDTTTRQNSVHIRHHAGNPSHVEVFPAHAFCALQALVDIAFDWGVPVAHVAHVDGKFLGVFRDLEVFLGQYK